MKIGIFGTGAYGLALSSILTDNHCELTMWTKFIEEKEQLEEQRKNEKLLSGYELAPNVKITTDVRECLEEKELLIIAIPVAFITSLCQEIKPFLREQPILIASKGIEQKTGLFVHQILEQELQTKNIAVLSGPTFAIDIPQKEPIALTVATQSLAIQQQLSRALSNTYTTIEYSEDIIGVEVAGAMKNIFALSSGILEGLGCNSSTKAKFFKNYIEEEKKLIDQLGGNSSTMLTYAGVGDLFLTCTSIESRNFSYGKLLAITDTNKKEDQQKREEYLKNNTLEGIYTLKSVTEILEQKKISLPFINTMNDILYKNKSAKEILKIFSKN